MQMASLSMRTIPDESAYLLAAAVRVPSICRCTSGVCLDSIARNGADRALLRKGLG
jgi:hypothetical protein